MASHIMDLKTGLAGIMDDGPAYNIKPFRSNEGSLVTLVAPALYVISGFLRDFWTLFLIFVDFMQQQM